MRTGNLICIRQELPDAARTLSEAIAVLSSQEETRLGQPDENARPHSNTVLFREINISLSAEQKFPDRRFKQIKDKLEKFQRVRNRTAHTLPDGTLSECDEQQARDAISFLNEFLAGLFEAVIADKARQLYSIAS
jgi:hypothetical protein